MKYLSKIILTFFIILLACDDNEMEFDLQYLFTVENNEVYSGFVDNQIDTEYKLITEYPLEEPVIHTFLYSVQQEGYYLLNGEILEENKEYNIESDLLNHLFYIGKEPGTHIVDLTFNNEHGYTVKKELKYNITQPVFTFDADVIEPTIYINELGIINYVIETESGTEQSFEYKFSLDETSVATFDEGVTQNVWTEIEEQTGSFSYNPQTVGNHDVILTVRNQFGDEVSKNLTIVVNNPAFTFEANFIENTIFSDGKGQINYVINPAIETEQNFEYKFTTDKEGLIDENNQNIWVTLEELSGSLMYDPSIIGTHNLTLTVRNQYGVEMPINIQIQVTNPEFDLTAVFEQTSIFIDGKAIMNYVVTPKGEEPQTFEYKFTTDKEGTLETNGKNTWVTLEELSGSLMYDPSIIGTHDIELTVKNQFGVEASVTLQLQVNNPGFDLTAQFVEQSIFSTELGTLNYIINPGENSSQTFEYKFSTDKEGILNGNILNIWMPLEELSGSLLYKGLETGLHTLKLYVRNQYGIENTVDLTIVVTNPDFDFTASFVQTEVFVGSEAQINYALNSNTEDQNFEYKFISSLQGKINSNSQNIWSELSQRTGTLSYIASETGLHRVTLYAKNQYGEEKTVDLEIIVKNPDFNLDATFVETSLVLNKEGNLNYTINPENGSNQTFRYKFETSGQGTLGGENENVWTSLSTLDGSLKYLGLTPGTHRITFSVKNQYGIEKSKDLTIVVTNPNFDFTASFVKSELFLNEEGDINYNVNPNIAGQSFQIKFVSNKTGVLNGNITNNVWSPLTSNSGKLTYKPQATGSHSVKLYVKNQYGIEKTVSLNINVINPTFDFTASFVKSELFINEIGDINYNVNPNIAGQNFQVKFVSNKNGVLNGSISNNVWTPLTSNSGKITYTPREQGTHSLSLYVKNQYGIEKRINLNISVINPQFDFNVTPNSLNKYQTETKQLTGVISNDASGTNSYEVKVNGNIGSLVYNGVTLNDNTWVTVSNPSNMIFTYSKSTLGLDDFEIQVRNEYTTKIKAISINTIKESFTISNSTITQVEASTGQEKSINLNVNTQFSGTKYYVKFAKTGGGNFAMLKSNNSIMNFNTWYEIPLNNTFKIRGITSSTSLAGLGIQVKDEYGNLATNNNQVFSFEIYKAPTINSGTMTYRAAYYNDESGEPIYQQTIVSSSFESRVAVSSIVFNDVDRNSSRTVTGGITGTSMSRTLQGCPPNGGRDYTERVKKVKVTLNLADGRSISRTFNN